MCVYSGYEKIYRGWRLLFFDYMCVWGIEFDEVEGWNYVYPDAVESFSGVQLAGREKFSGGIIPGAARYFLIRALGR